MLYQLSGPTYLKPGDKVDMGYPGERWGIIIKVVEANYKIPNKSFATGATKFLPQPLNLFLIRGGYENPHNEKYPTVWGFSS